MKFYASLSPTKKSVLWYTAATIIQNGIMFLATPIYTRILTESEYGIFSVYQAWQQIVSIVSVIAADRCVTIGFMKFSIDRKGFLSSLQAMMTLTVLIFLLISALFMSGIERISGLPAFVIFTLLIISLMNNSFANWSWYQRYKYSYRELASVTILFTIAIQASGIIAVMYVPFENKGYLMIMAFAAAKVILYSNIYIRVFLEGRTFYNREYWNFSFFYSAAILPHALAQIILNSSDRLIIDRLCGREEAAYYGIVYTAASVLSIVVISVHSAIQPWFLEKIRQHDFTEIRKKTNIFLVVTGCIVVMASLVSPYVMIILAPPSYSVALKCFPPVAASTFFQAMYLCFSLFEGYYEKPVYFSIATVVGASMNILLNYIFIPLFGFVAAGYTTLACFMLFALMHYCFMRRICKEKLNGIKIFDIKFIILSSLSVVIISILVLLN